MLNNILIKKYTFQDRFSRLHQQKELLIACDRQIISQTRIIQLIHGPGFSLAEQSPSKILSEQVDVLRACRVHVKPYSAN